MYSLNRVSAMRQEAPAPFITWTFRRSGGTNFGNRLFERSPFKTVQHEPFNTDRLFGAVTRNWMESSDETILKQEIREICEKKVLIKHCLEIIPARVNTELVHASVEMGYRHLFLYRREPLGRLLSLHFAKLSGVWGKKQRARVEIDDSIFDTEIPVERLVKHECHCRSEMRRLLDLIEALGGTPILIAFEDLFGAERAGEARREVHSVLDLLGMSRSQPEDTAFIKEVLGRGDQGTRDMYSKFRGYEDLVTALKVIGPFELRPNVRLVVNYPESLPTPIAACMVWEPRPDVESRRFVIAGVVICRASRHDARLELETVEGGVDVRWGLPSPWAGLRFKDYPLAGYSRFNVERVAIPEGDQARLVLVMPGGDRQVLAEITNTPFTRP